MISAVSGLSAKEVLGKARHYAHYHVTILENVFIVFNKPCTVLTPTNNAHFFSKIIYSKLLIILVKEPPEIALQIGKYT